MSQVGTLHRWVCPWGSVHSGQGFREPMGVPPMVQNPNPSQAAPVVCLADNPSGLMWQR